MQLSESCGRSLEDHLKLYILLFKWEMDMDEYGLSFTLFSNSQMLMLQGSLMKNEGLKLIQLSRAQKVEIYSYQNMKAIRWDL